jgi:prepilin-type N-terminal cleavage/methylation domain-containing protein
MIKKGYTLVEIAVVLVAAGVLVAVSAGGILPLYKANSNTKVLNLANDADNWVKTFIRTYKRLPTTEEFNAAGFVNGDTKCEYNINKKIVKFNIPELYSSYRMNPNDNLSYVDVIYRGQTVTSGVKLDYAYYIDTIDGTTPDDKPIIVNRHICRYDDLLALLGRSDTSRVTILTDILPPAKREDNYSAKLRIRGGLIPDNSTYLNRKLRITFMIMPTFGPYYSNADHLRGCSGSSSGQTPGSTSCANAYRTVRNLYEDIFDHSYVSYVNDSTSPLMLPYSKTTPIVNNPNSMDVEFEFKSKKPIPGFGDYKSSSIMTKRYTGEYFILRVGIYDDNDPNASLNASSSSPTVIKNFRIDMNPLR